MVKSEIKPGAEYALREKRVEGAPFQRVKVIAHIRRNKWKVEWIDPNPGLTDYVESGQLVTPWSQRRAFLKEEENERRLREHNERHGYTGEETPIVDALYEVFENVGEEVNFYRGILSGSAEVIDRLRARAGISPTQNHSYVAYTTRHGQLRLPFDEALDLARRFCAAEPAAVLLSVEATEQKWTSEVSHGDTYLISLLNRYRAAWALIRQWAGYDAALAQKDAQIQKLERVVWDAVYALQRAGLDHEAARLRRELGRA